jgi:hypothetical protein
VKIFSTVSVTRRCILHPHRKMKAASTGKCVEELKHLYTAGSNEIGAML